LDNNKKISRTADLNQIFTFPKFSEWSDLKVDLINEKNKRVRFSKVNGELVEIVLDELTWDNLLKVFATDHFRHKYGTQYDYFIKGTSYQKLYDIPDNCTLHIRVTLSKELQNTRKTTNMYQKVMVPCSLDVFHLVNAFALKNNSGV